MADLFATASVKASAAGMSSSAGAAARYASSVASKLQTMKFEAYDDIGSDANDSATSSSYLDGNRNDVLNLNPTEAKIQLDDRAYTFEFVGLPSRIGKKIVLQCKLGNMWTQFSSQKNDVAEASSKPRPAGNHDLVQSIDMQIKTNLKSSFLVRFPTVNAYGEEHYYGGSGADADAGKKLSYMFTSADFKGDVASVNILSRNITQSMKHFLERYPNQTADTLPGLAGPVPGGKEMMVRYSADSTGVTSAVVLWYNSQVVGYTAEGAPLKNPPLQPLNAEYTTMPRDIYDACFAKAQDEMVRYISLGDVTSEVFSLEISHPNGLDLGDFAAQYPGYSENQIILDQLTQEQIKARDLHMRTPIYFTGRVVIGYKKVHTGEDSL